MKTTNIKMILCLVFLRLAHVSQAQSLFIDGEFYDKHQNNIVVEYKLVTGNENVVTGYTRKLKVELQLGKEYVLLITKDGFVSKTINISTQTKQEDDYVFLFDAVLDKTTEKVQRTKASKNEEIVVFYDNAINDFNYYHPNKNEISY